MQTMKKTIKAITYQNMFDWINLKLELKLKKKHIEKNRYSMTRLLFSIIDISLIDNQGTIYTPPPALVMHVK